MTQHASVSKGRVNTSKCGYQALPIERFSVHLTEESRGHREAEASLEGTAGPEEHVA